jgi:hypothetical protein
VPPLKAEIHRPNSEQIVGVDAWRDTGRPLLKRPDAWSRDNPFHLDFTSPFVGDVSVTPREELLRLRIAFISLAGRPSHLGPLPNRWPENRSSRGREGLDRAPKPLAPRHQMIRSLPAG